MSFRKDYYRKMDTIVLFCGNKWVNDSQFYQRKTL